MTTTDRSAEHVRQIVHIAMGGFALLLRYISSWQAELLAAAALIFNGVVLRRIGGARLYRPDDRTRGFSTGIILYPLAVLLLIFTFPNRLDIVAAAWGILAAGDGMATLVGRAVRGPRIPWNSDKTYAGSVALILFGGSAGAFLAWWCRPAVIPPAYFWFSVGAPFVAALAAAAVETVPIRLDDNLSVPASAAAVLWALSLVSEDLARSAWIRFAGFLPLAVVANGLVAASGYVARTVSRSGAVAGAIIGITIFVSTGWSGWALLLLTFAVATISSHMGITRKTRLGIAQEHGGRRGAGNAIANTGCAAIAALLAVTTYAALPALVGFAAALTAAGSDTVASEVGKAWGRRTYLVPTFRRVSPGMSGGVSLEGTSAGLLAAALLAAAAVWLGIVPRITVWPIVAGATAGSFVESLLGATLEHRGLLNNDSLNFINTAVAAATAVALAGDMR